MQKSLPKGRFRQRFVTAHRNIFATSDKRPLKYFWGRFSSATQLSLWQRP